MKIPTKTKEKLTEELLKLQSIHAYCGVADEHRRKEFAKAFNWIKNTQYVGMSHIEKEPQLPSWEQIFVHIGKLLVLEELKQTIVPKIIPYEKHI